MAKETLKPPVNKASSLWFEPDILAPNQYFRNWQRSSPAKPEKTLMLAVLVEAINTYQRFAFSNSPRGRSLFREAEAWFWREGPTDSVFAFRNICDVFGLNPGFLRRGLMQWTASREPNKAPRKKIQLHLERSRARKSLNDIGKKLSNYRDKVRDPTAPNHHLVSPSDEWRKTANSRRWTDVWVQKSPS